MPRWEGHNPPPPTHCCVFRWWQPCKAWQTALEKSQEEQSGCLGGRNVEQKGRSNPSRSFCLSLCRWLVVSRGSDRYYLKSQRALTYPPQMLLMAPVVPPLWISQQGRLCAYLWDHLILCLSSTSLWSQPLRKELWASLGNDWISEWRLYIALCPQDLLNFQDMVV